MSVMCVMSSFFYSTHLPFLHARPDKLAQMQIKFLDDMINHLKERRHKCQTQMDTDAARMARIDIGMLIRKGVLLPFAPCMNACVVTFDSVICLV
jgi:hypothetical protein